MAELRAEHFQDYFHELHKRPPFPWQEALAERVCTGDWPEVIDLPTASGKTACIDVALFALAVRGNEVPRRIFFVVDRRVVVNEAYLRMRRVRDSLKEAKSGLLYEIAERFRAMARGNEPTEQESEPLLVSEMRGGAFRDESWVTNPLQPAVIASTVDQVGSRLLFRGYGVSPNSWPLHAGLIGNDALILLDEAHCSRAFAQTLMRVEVYRGKDWASQGLDLPFQFVEMTATPSHDPKPEKKMELGFRDREVEALKKRFEAEKPTQLIEIKGRRNDTGKLVDSLVAQALELAADVDARRVVVFTNRVKTAKQVYQQLRERTKETSAQVELVIGSMRPVDREDLERRLSERLKSDVERDPGAPITFVVSTQCLEVGADLDFDVLVTECASVDALLQRFGRLDRLGKFERAHGAIVIGSWQTDAKQPDPVYGEALAKTWAWLKQMAGEGDRMNMGIRSRAGGASPTIKELFEGLDPKDRPNYCLPARNSAILLPAHVDMLAQTSPPPQPDPLIEVFLHGPQQSAPEVQVVWRSDLEDADEEEAIEIVRLCPPSSREAMPVSLAAFRRWYAGNRDVLAQESDLESGTDLDAPEDAPGNHVIAWDGEGGSPITRPNQIRPGQTLVVKASAGGWDELGFIPSGAVIDVADRAAFTLRKGVTLRLHPEVIRQWPDTPSRQALLEAASGAGTQLDDLENLFVPYRRELVERIVDNNKPWPLDFLEQLDTLRQRRLDSYPGTKSSYVLRGRQCGSRQNHGGQVLLQDHVDHVERQAASMSSDLGTSLKEAVICAARLHDFGKADIRYQAWLRGGDEMAARYGNRPIAKSGNDVLLAQKDVGLPEGFRHELLSLLFAEKSPGADSQMRDLTLHLVAAHHGRCRPFAPVIPDPRAECVSYRGIAVCKEERVENAPHRLDRGVPDRFWRLMRVYGWWGLAYLEALLRLADWKASHDEAAEVSYE